MIGARLGLALVLLVPGLAYAKGGGGGHGGGGGGHSSGGGGGGGHGGGGGGHSSGGSGSSGGGHSSGTSHRSGSGGSSGGHSGTSRGGVDIWHSHSGHPQPGGSSGAGTGHGDIIVRDHRHHPAPSSGGTDTDIDIDVGGIDLGDGGDSDGTTDTPDCSDDPNDPNLPLCPARDDDFPASAEPAPDPVPTPVVNCGAGTASANEIVGFRTCTRFGQWAMPTRMPAMGIDMGLQTRSLSLSHMGSAHAVTWTARYSVGITHGLYVAVESEIGGVTGDLPHPDTAISGNAFMVGGYFVAGVRGAVHRVSLSTELAAGGRLVQLDARNTAGDVAPTTLDSRGVLEARARAELWINPWLSGGLVIGAGLVDQHEALGGAFLSFHSRAFSGDRR